MPMNKCPICNKCTFTDLFSLGRQPLANKYPKNLKEIKVEKKYNLNLKICSYCHFIKIKKIISRELMFEEYFYLSSVNESLKKHFENLVFKIKKKYKKNSFVLNIGSNDGVLLAPLKKNNIKCLGVDPSKNVSKIANKNGLKTLVGFFDSKMTEKILNNFKKPNVIVASSIFTHVENPIQFIKNIKRVLSKNGVFILEIEYVANFFKNIEFERFYFDRPNYYSITSINEICKRENLYISNIEKIPTHGGSIRIYIKKTKSVSKKLINILNYENKFFKKNNLTIYFKEFKSEINNLLQNLKLFKKNKVEVIGYGSPARLSTITNFANIKKNLISYIVEDNKLKQNRNTPGMHIPIVKKILNEENVKVIIVFAYDYFSSIKKKKIIINIFFISQYLLKNFYDLFFIERYRNSRVSLDISYQLKFFAKLKALFESVFLNSSSIISFSTALTID